MSISTVPSSNAATVVEMPTVRTHSVLTVIYPASLIAFAAGTAHAVAVGTYGIDPNRGGMRIINLDAESTAISWYASAVLGFAAVLLWTAGRLSSHLPVRARYGWYVLALAFVLLSLDEVAQVHETMNAVGRHLGVSTDLVLFRWVLVAIPAIFVLGAVLIPFLWHLERRTLVSFILSGVVFVSGAVGMEIVGGSILQDEGAGRSYMTAVVVEEGMEILGATMFVGSILAHLRRFPNSPSLTIRF